MASTSGLTDSSSVPREVSESGQPISEAHHACDPVFCAAPTGTQEEPVTLSSASPTQVIEYSQQEDVDDERPLEKEPSPDPRPVMAAPAPVYLLPPKKASTVLTVVLDLDETLVSNRRTADPIPRPYVQAVLHRLRDKPNVEVVLWTASIKDVARSVLAALHEEDEECCFDHTIFRNKFWFTKGSHTKDLRLLGRPMDKVLIVENSIHCCKLNPYNAILVEDYRGEETDSSLVNVYYMIETMIQLMSDGHTVSSALHALAKENLLCGWEHHDLPDPWKRVPLNNISPHDLPAFGWFVKSKKNYDAA